MWGVCSALIFRFVFRQALEEEQLGRERASDSETEVLRRANLLVTKTLFRCVRLYDRPFLPRFASCCRRWIVVIASLDCVLEGRARAHDMHTRPLLYF